MHEESFMARVLPLVAFAALAVAFIQTRPLSAERPRLAVLTDIGGDPDDQQSMVRLMMYSNEFMSK